MRKETLNKEKKNLQETQIYILAKNKKDILLEGYAFFLLDDVFSREEVQLTLFMFTLLQSSF